MNSCIIPQWLNVVDFIISLVANLATAFSLCTLFITLINFNKNKVSTQNIDVQPILLKNNIRCLCVSNFTDQDFFIYKIILTVNNQEYIAYKKENNGIFIDTIEVKNIRVAPHQALDIKCFFDIKIEKKSILTLKTTQGDLIYKINPNTNNK